MLVVELVELKLVLFPHCLGQKGNGDQTLNQSNKVWHDRRPGMIVVLLQCSL